MNQQGFVGMDVHMVRELSGQMSQAANAIEASIGKLTAAMDAVPWQGADAEKFRSQWRGTQVAKLKRVVADLREAAGVTSTRADQQQRVADH